METINIPKQKYEELLEKAQKLEELENQKDQQKEIKTMDDLPADLKEEMEILERASDEDLANWEKKHLSSE